MTRIIRRASSSRFGRAGRRAKSNRIELHAFVTPGYGSLAKVGDDELFEGFHALDHGRGHHRGRRRREGFFSGALVKVVDDEVEEFEQVGMGWHHKRSSSPVASSGPGVNASSRALR